jgi:tetratricopeptide (TPR) repeat protein
MAGRRKHGLAPTGLPLADMVAREMEAQSLSLAGFARRVRRAAEKADEEYSGASESLVCKWRAGQVTPSENHARLIAKATNLPVPVVVAAAEIQRKLVAQGSTTDGAPDLPRLGTSDAPPSRGPQEDQPGASSAGLIYSPNLDHALATVTSLWTEDRTGRTLLYSLPERGAWTSAALHWLVTPADSLTDRSSTRIGATDILAVRSATARFAELDNRFGGGAARQLLVQYLASDVSSMLNGSYSESDSRALLSAASEATLLAAWMSYDAGLHGAAQRYFVQALRLAKAANDHLLGTSILAAMSHQATFLGDFGEAADLARAASMGGRTRTTATLVTLFHAQEARACAAAGDERGCTMALTNAESHFAKCNPADDPEWIRYFDEGELAAEFAHCFRDLDQPDRAIEYANRSLSLTDAKYVRSNLFCKLVLATAQLQQGDSGQACDTAASAIDVYGQIGSVRPSQYIDDFRRRLDSSGDGRAIQQLNETMRQSRLINPIAPDR